MGMTNEDIENVRAELLDAMCVEGLSFEALGARMEPPRPRQRVHTILKGPATPDVRSLNEVAEAMGRQVRVRLEIKFASS